LPRYNFLKYTGEELNNAQMTLQVQGCASVR